MKRAQARGKLAVHQGRLFDDQGREVILRGVNTGGRSKFAPFAPFDFASSSDFEMRLARFCDLVAGLCVNVVRLPFSWEAIEPTRGCYDDAYLERYRAIIRAMWARDIYTIVDFHQDVFASPFGGDGFPLWTIGEPHGPPRHDLPDGEWFVGYVTPGSPVQRAFDRFWANSDGIFDAFVAMWRHMASATAAEPGVIGFEIINEPGWGTDELARFEATTLPRALTTAGRAIDEVAPDHLLFAGGCGPDALMASTSLGRPDLPRLFYAPHYYDMSVGTGGKYHHPGAPRLALETFAKVGTNMDAPVLLGEFGGANKSPDQLRWMRDVYDALDEFRMHATLWEASTAAEEWNHEDFRIFASDGTEKPAVSELVRPYPRAIAGRIDWFSFDAAARTFRIAVSDARTEESEISLPVRSFTRNPTITGSGAIASFVAEREVLVVRSQAKQWTLVVQAP